MEHRRDENLLSIEELTKVFNIRHGLATTHFVAVDHISLALQAARPEILAVAGESGSGKTTLARMILGQVKPSSGRRRGTAWHQNRADLARRKRSTACPRWAARLSDPTGLIILLVLLAVAFHPLYRPIDEGALPHEPYSRLSNSLWRERVCCFVGFPNQSEVIGTQG